MKRLAKGFARRVRSWNDFRVAQARKKRWEAASQSGQSFVVTQQDGVRITLYPDSRFCEFFYLRGIEHTELEFFRRFLREGDVVFDVGANIGVFSLTAAAAIGQSGKAYAFEPSRETFDRLRENVSLNGFSTIECHRIALSNEVGRKQLASSRDGHDAWNSLSDRPYMGDIYDSEEVSVETLDQFCEVHRISHITLMKIDVEGWEDRVLHGGANLLSRDDAPVLQVEFTDKAAIAAGSTCAQLYRSLVTFGYTLYRFDPISRSLVPDPIRDSYPYLNLVAVKDIKSTLIRLANAQQ